MASVLTAPAQRPVAPDIPSPLTTPASGGGATPSVSHASAAAVDDDRSATAVAVALDIVARELEPMVATFFRVDADDRIATSVAHGSHLPPAELLAAVRTWKAALDGIDPLSPVRLATLDRRVATLADVGGTRTGAANARLHRSYRRIGVVNDARMPIRDGGRVVAGVTLWRPLRSPPWTGAQLRVLSSLQPLVEHVYLSCRSAAAGDAWLPPALTRRQRQVARLLAAGATNPEVARALQLSPDTAKSHTRAVLTKLGVSSRRGVAMRAGRASATNDVGGDGRHATASQPEALGVLLGLTLDWAAERIGAVAGGCALLSPRLDVVADACGVAPSAKGSLDPRVPLWLQRGLLTVPDTAGVVALATSEGLQPPVVDLGAAASDAVDTGLRALLARSGLTAPLLLATRVDGRVASLVWLVFRRDRDRHEGARAVRRLHPLLEVACGLASRAALAPARLPADLERRGLTPRELAIARLALAGDGNEAIAERLDISPATVKNHMTRVLAKCGVGNRTQLIALARGR